MEISKEQFFQAATKVGLSEENKEALWETLEAESSKSSFISKLLYYFGAMIVISAMTWFMNLGWMAFGGGWLFLISVLYAIVFVLVGSKLWKKEELKIPAGLLITIAVCMVPLAIYGLEFFFGILPDSSTHSYNSFYIMIKSSWIWMEMGTVFAGLLALRFYPFSFLTAPIWFAAWFLSMDVIPLLIGNEGSFELKAWISLAFGALLLLIAYILDHKDKPEYGFWGYLFGTITFWGSLGALCVNKEGITLFIYLLINILMMVASIILNRKVLMIFGALGTFFYFCHLAYDIFEHSILFPFALTFLGLLTIYLGVLYQKNSKWIEKKILGLFRHH